MTQVFLGQIIQGGWNFAPRGFALCAGQQMAIAQNTALFSLLGTSFGGNGQTTFGVPDLRGRAAINWGQGPGLQNYDLGEVVGTENTTLTQLNLPAHTHTATFTSTGGTINATLNKATQQNPLDGGFLAQSIEGQAGNNSLPMIYRPAGGTPTFAAIAGVNAAGTVAVAPTGNGQPFSLLNPRLAVTIVIAIAGVFPSRN